MADRAYLERLTKELADSGWLIEAGWVGLRVATDLIDAPADQLAQMRATFFAGAQHLLGSIMTFLDEQQEITEADMRRMDLIQNELDTFIVEFAKAHMPTQGSA